MYGFFPHMLCPHHMFVNSTHANTNRRCCHTHDFSLSPCQPAFPVLSPWRAQPALACSHLSASLCRHTFWITFCRKYTCPQNIAISVRLFLAIASSLMFSRKCTCPPNTTCASMCLKSHVHVAQRPRQRLPVFSHWCLHFIGATFSPLHPTSPSNVVLTQQLHPITASVFNATPAVQHLTLRVPHVSVCLCCSCFIAHLLSQMHLPSKHLLHICVHFYSRHSQRNPFQAMCSALESKHPSHRLHSNLRALIALAYTAVHSSDKGATRNRRGPHRAHVQLDVWLSSTLTSMSHAHFAKNTMSTYLHFVCWPILPAHPLHSASIGTGLLKHGWIKKYMVLILLNKIHTFTEVCIVVPVYSRPLMIMCQTLCRNYIMQSRSR